MGLLIFTNLLFYLSAFPLALICQSQFDLVFISDFLKEQYRTISALYVLYVAAKFKVIFSVAAN